MKLSTFLKGLTDEQREEIDEAVLNDYEPEGIEGAKFETVVSDCVNSDAFIVFSFTPTGGETKLYRLDGYYNSYAGTEWDGRIEDAYEVVKSTKTVTVYEKPKRAKPEAA